MLGIERANSSSNPLLKDWTKVERAQAIGSIFAIIILTSCIVLGSTGNFGMVTSHPEAFLGSLAGLTMLGLIFIVLGKSQKPTLNQTVQSNEANSSQTKNSVEHSQHQTRQVSQPIAPSASSITEVRSENHCDTASTVTTSTTVPPLVASVHSTPIISLPSSISAPLPLTGRVNGSSSASPVVPMPVEIPTVAVTMRCKGTLLKFRNDNEVFNIAKLDPKMTVAELTRRVLTDILFQTWQMESRAQWKNFEAGSCVSVYREKVRDIVIQNSEGNDLDANITLENIPNLNSLHVRFRTWVYFKSVDGTVYHDPRLQRVAMGAKQWNVYAKSNYGNVVNLKERERLLEALTDPSFTDNEIVNDMHHHIISERIYLNKEQTLSINIGNLKRFY